MKIKDIIQEAKAKSLSKNMKASGIHARQLPIDSYYDLYRFGVALAGEPDNDAPISGPANTQPTMWMYTDADVEIVKRAEKNQGIKGKTIIGPGPSEELKSTNTNSPIPLKKKNKYGV